jgi:signal transduction histidine kinase/ligand-binding sensor domain-containing protein/DNA-binding response OmpR family regulator
MQWSAIHCLFFFVLLYANLHGQQVKYLNVADGLSSRHTYGIEKDHKGFMWFATDEGIDRYDGLEFRNYKLWNSSIIPTNQGYRFNITLDTSKNIWAYTTTGKVFRFNQYTDEFELIFDINNALNKSINTLNKSISIAYIFNIFIDRNNTIWIGSNSGAYYAKINVNTVDCLHSCYKYKSYTFQESGNGYLWAGTNDGVKIFSEDSSKINYLSNGRVCLSTKNMQIRSLFLDSLNQKLWIGSERNGPSVFDFRQQRLFDLINLTPKVRIKCIGKDLNNDILIGMDGAGIIMVDAKNNKIKKLWNGNEDIHGRLADNSVLDIFCDSDDRIWVSTYMKGITILDNKKPKIDLIHHEFNKSNSLRTDQVFSIFEDSDHDLWYGTNEGVSIYSSLNNKWDHLQNIKEPYKISDYKILAITEDDRKRIWIGGYSNGALCYDKKNKILSDFSRQVGINYIYSIYYDKKGYMWFGGIEGKISRMELKTGQFIQFNLINITKIINKNDNQLWAGTTNGLYIIDKNSGESIYYTKLLSDSTSLSNNYVTNLLQSKDGLLYIGTNGGGLNCLNTNKKSIEVFSIEHGLPSNFINGILTDQNGRIWISTEKGIACFDPDAKKSINIGFIQGLTNDAFNRNAQSKLSSGKIMFGSSNGAVQFSPDSIKSFTGKSYLVFDEFRLAYRRVLPGDDNSPLKVPVDELTKINLKHDQNSFSFRFSSINFDNADQFVYQWQLRGFDKEWVPLTRNRVAGYTNIPYGNYTFFLRCINHNDLSIIDERSIQLFINPPFWKTKLSMVLYLIILAGIVFILYKIQQNHLQKKHSADKIRFFINTAHDLRTPVSLIESPLKNLESEKGYTKNGLYYLRLAQSNVQRLSEMITQILDFDKFDSKKSSIVLSFINLNTYLLEKISLFQLLADEKQVMLKHSIPKEEINISFDIDNLDKILNNLFSNAIKYTQRGGQIELTLSTNEKFWILSISDTGIGIPRKEQKHLFNLYYRAENAINTRKPGSGLGLIMVQNLVKMHGGKISFTSQENIGSTFTLTFPMAKTRSIQEAKTEFGSLLAGNLFNKAFMWREKLNSNIHQLPKTHIKILVVEDDDELRDYLSFSLSGEYLVSEAQDGQIAYDLIEKEKFDLVISDIMMPIMSGDELCRKIKTNIDTSHIPVILLTALSDKKNTLVGLGYGADIYINKPFDIEVVKARISNIINNRQLIKNSLLKGVEPATDKVFISNLDKSIIKNVLFIVERELSNPDFSLTDLCRELAMSRSLMYKKIKAHTGLAPNEFIRTIRLNKALDLLKSTELPINEIAFKVGFQDSKYFSTNFKKFFGKSPKHFRN